MTRRIIALSVFLGAISLSIFEDGTSIPWKGVNFTIARGVKGPFTYDVAINDDGPTISSSQLPVYRPQ